MTLKITRTDVIGVWMSSVCSFVICIALLCFRNITQSTVRLRPTCRPIIDSHNFPTRRFHGLFMTVSSELMNIVNIGQQ